MDQPSLKDHNTNSISARIFVNPSIILGSPTDAKFISIELFQMFSFNLAVKYVPGTSPTKGIYFEIQIYKYPNTANFFNTEPLISAPTWVDIVATFEFVRNSAGILNMQEKVYSSGWNNPFTQTVCEAMPDQDLVTLVNVPSLVIWNYHLSDFTLQYLG